MCIRDRLNTECNSQHFSRTSNLYNLDGFEEEEAETYSWRAELLDAKKDMMTICDHHKQVFGNVFERRINKCCGVLMNHRRKVKSEKSCRWQNISKPNTSMFYQDIFYAGSVSTNFN